MIDEDRLKKKIEEILNEEAVFCDVMLYAEGVEDELFDEVMLDKADDADLDILEWSIRWTSEGHLYLDGSAKVSSSVGYGFIDVDDWREQAYSKEEIGRYYAEGVVSFSSLLDDSYNIIECNSNYIEEITGTFCGKRMEDYLNAMSWT